MKEKQNKEKMPQEFYLFVFFFLIISWKCLSIKFKKEATFIFKGMVICWK